MTVSLINTCDNHTNDLSDRIVINRLACKFLIEILRSIYYGKVCISWKNR